MRTTLLIAAFGIALAAPALAQSTSTTQTPPSPNAASGAPDPSNSLPAGAGTAATNRAGDVVGRETTTSPATGTAAPPVRR